MSQFSSETQSGAPRCQAVYAAGRLPSQQCWEEAVSAFVTRDLKIFCDHHERLVRKWALPGQTNLAVNALTLSPEGATIVYLQIEDPYFALGDEYWDTEDEMSRGPMGVEYAEEDSDSEGNLSDHENGGISLMDFNTDEATPQADPHEHAWNVNGEDSEASLDDSDDDMSCGSEWADSFESRWNASIAVVVVEMDDSQLGDD